MTTTASGLNLRQVGILLRGEPGPINGWVQEWNGARLLVYLAIIIAGTSLYGAAMGCWREPLQGIYAAIKFPLIVLLTTLGNGLANGMLAPLLGVNIGFRQSLQAVLMSFTIAAAILASFSPVIFFLVWNAPPLSARISSTYDFIMLTHVAVIAFAGMAANLRLGQLLERLGGSAAAGRRVLIAWLTGNLFLGAQLSWILRPFIGIPGLPVEFVRPNALSGTFYEAVFNSLKHLFSP